MSKKQFKSQASSSRAFSSTFGGQHESFGGVGLGAALSFGSISSSSLSYIYEPPDLSQISDSGAVVAFKNLQKKDSTTKTKALEGLQNVIKSLTLEKKEVEEGILQAWVCLLRHFVEDFFGVGTTVLFSPRSESFHGLQLTTSREYGNLRTRFKDRFLSHVENV